MADHSVNLWSSLALTETTHQIECPPGVRVTVRHFAEALRQRIERNRIDAEVHLEQVRWDDDAESSTKILVRPGGAKEFASVIRVLVDLSSEGVFTHLDERVILLPPPAVRARRSSLPYREFEPIGENRKVLGWGLAGLGLVSAAGALATLLSSDGVGAGLLFSLCFFVFAGLLGVSGGAILSASRNIKLELESRSRMVNADRIIVERHNAKVEAWNAEADRERALLRAWSVGVKQLVLTRRRDNPAGKWASAVSSTIQQVIDELFYSYQARLQERTEVERTEGDIMGYLEKRDPEVYGIVIAAFRG